MEKLSPVYQARQRSCRKVSAIALETLQTDAAVNIICVIVYSTDIVMAITCLYDSKWVVQASYIRPWVTFITMFATRHWLSRFDQYNTVTSFPFRLPWGNRLLPNYLYSTYNALRACTRGRKTIGYLLMPFGSSNKTKDVILKQKKFHHFSDYSS